MLIKNFLLLAFIILSVVPPAAAAAPEERGGAAAFVPDPIWKTSHILGDQCAAKLLYTGVNPYDPAKLIPCEEQHWGTVTRPLVRFYPPWYFLLLGPLLLLPPGVLIFTLLLISIAGAVLLLQLTPGALNGGVRLTDAVLAFIIVSPSFAEALLSGQISIITAAAFAAVLIALRHKKDLSAGLCFIPLLLKPHPVYLALAAIGVYAIKEKRWRFIGAAAAGWIIVIAASAALWPQAIKQWLSAEYPLDSRTASVITNLRDLSLDQFSSRADWLVFALPALSLLIFLGVLIARKRITLSILPLAICFSFITNPYNWPYDYILLVLPAAAIAAVARNRALSRYYRFELYFCLLQILLLASALRYAGADVSYQWLVPALVAALYVRAKWELEPKGMREQASEAVSVSPL